MKSNYWLRERKEWKKEGTNEREMMEYFEEDNPGQVLSDIKCLNII